MSVKMSVTMSKENACKIGALVQQEMIMRGTIITKSMVLDAILTGIFSSQFDFNEEIGINELASTICMSFLDKYVPEKELFVAIDGDVYVKKNSHLVIDK